MRNRLILTVAFTLVAGTVLGALADDPGIVLDIPDVAWATDRPDPSLGWSAEACIQAAMAYFGVAVSQLEIYEAGEPDNPNLHSPDIDDALDDVDVEYDSWHEDDPSLAEFITWIQQHLRDGSPVLCGIKIYPDEHPDRSLDHFVLVVGYDEDGLLLNTQLNLDGQIYVSYTQLTSRDPGYTFENSLQEYFGRAITGVDGY